MTYWQTFAQMRKDEKREWFRMSDLEAEAFHAGARLTRYQIRRILASLPPPTVKKYGHWHYTEEHRKAVIAAVKEKA
jgi:hypothetical protein